MSAQDAHRSKKEIRERGWELAANEREVTVFRSRKSWATWIPLVMLMAFAANTYREVATTDNVHNTVLASIIWGVALLGPAALVFWWWGYDRKRAVARFMNRRDTSDGVSITLRDTAGMRHDFLVPGDEADRLERLIERHGDGDAPSA